MTGPVMKYGGRVVYCTDGPDGPLEVVDEHLIRSLHFGDATRQSSMLHAHPAVMVLPYTQYMLVSLVFRPEPRRILMLGLGGGSLPRFFAHHFPAAAMDAVELRADVIAAARRYFGLPETPGFSVHNMDCARFAADADAACGDYDLVLLDIYDSAGIVSLVEDRRFLERLAARMAAEGILVANLSQVQRHLLRSSLRAIRATFAGDVLRVPVADKGNEVVLATTRPGLVPADRGAVRRAVALKERLGIDFPAFLAGLQRYDASLMERLAARRGARRRRR